MTIQTLLGKTILVLLVLLLSAGSALARTVECASRDFHYRHCRIKTYGDVSLERQISNTPCIRGRTWGYDRHGIWVDEGCHAIFRVRDDRRDRDRDRDSDSDAATAVLGALLGSAVTDRDRGDRGYDYRDRYNDYVPDWIVGTFRGYNPRSDAEVTLRVHSDGKVVADRRGAKIYGHYDSRNDQINIRGRRFEVERERGGFRMVELGDRRNVVHYARVR